ncbi:MAG: type II secretion system GspH family protein [Gammaproteobacteria bacterium]|nr:type II secretion system GspH family protein [Gammaproteobacteria bacterium]MBT8151410.1 type II secretion system GspH family protein [Gammaproteobacteria bacterium]NNM10989.1 type II secretion system protein [Pseudomonadales bacterium]
MWRAIFENIYFQGAIGKDRIPPANRETQRFIGINETFKKTNHRRHTSGFTLIEVIVGFVIGAFAIGLFTTLILPQLTRSTEPLFQVRAVELAQSILEQAAARQYDENTAVGGSPPCSSTGAPACTASGSLGPDTGETNRSNFDDIDDYDAFCFADNNIQDIFGNDISASGEFARFSFRFCVNYDGNYNGTLDEAGIDELRAKLLTVTVNPPRPAVPISISMYRGNY